MAKRKAVVKKSLEKRKVVRDVSVRKPKSILKPNQKPKSRPKTKQRPDPKILKLTIDLVPQTQWNKNLRKQVPRSVWDTLRKEVYAKAGFKCQVCSAEGKLHCHEIWEYEEKNLIQRLTGFGAVCNMCHHVAHFGMSSILANQGYLDIEEVIRHFMKVNGVSRKAFEKHFSEVTNTFQYRSQFEWVLDYGQWAALLPDKSA